MNKHVRNLRIESRQDTQRSDTNLSGVISQQNKLFEEQQKILKEHQDSIHNLMSNQNDNEKLNQFKHSIQDQNKEFQNTFSNQTYS